MRMLDKDKTILVWVMENRREYKKDGEKQQWPHEIVSFFFTDEPFDDVDIELGTKAYNSGSRLMVWDSSEAHRIMVRGILPHSYIHKEFN